MKIPFPFLRLVIYRLYMEFNLVKKVQLITNLPDYKKQKKMKKSETLIHVPELSTV